MAIVRAHVGLDFLGGIQLGSNVSIQSATTTELAVSDGTSVIRITGTGFAFSASGVTGGTVKGLSIASSGTPILDVTGLSVPLKDAAAFLMAGNGEGLLAAMFGGADEVFGSNEDDILASFGGDDLFRPGKGDDTFDGGGGTDTVVLTGSLLDYDITLLATGGIEIVNTVDPSEGKKLLTNVEVVRFGDASEYDLAALAAEGWQKHVADVELVASTYQFFTDRVPTAGGFGYLIDSAQNPNDLNDPYYEQFNRENRYINFASNLGTEGEGAAAFDAKFGALDFEATVKAAYLEIMGKALTGGALSFFLNAEGFYEAVAEQRVVRPGVDLAEATKIVAIGSILNEALKGGTGVYAEAVADLVFDVRPDGQSTLLGEDLFAIA
ncbi:MAG: hypothetical protein IT533_15150 [Hyphomicrobiales bacterium]|jgi:hypothetical protein|nr:hypothetical protein [Hyphomicrobiales bacterium]